MVVRERAQLILIGSIAIAVVLIGLTIILNSVIFTENVSQSDAIEVSGDVDEFLTETRRTTQDLTLRVNHAEEYTSLSRLNSNLNRNFTNYSRVLGEANADTGSVYVNISYQGEQTVGRRVVQSEDDNFTKNGSDDWAVDGGGSKYVGWFAMNVDVDNVSKSDHFKLRITNTSGNTLGITLRQSTSGDLRVNSTIDGNHVSNATCLTSNSRVFLDIVGGNALTSACSFNSTSYLEQPYSDIEFVNGSNAYGKYSVVVNDESGLNVADCPDSTEPCKTPAIWEATVNAIYETGTISYESTQDVNIYREGGTTSNANDVIFVSAAATDPPANSVVSFTLQNTGTSPVYVTDIAVNSTSNSTADWVYRIGGGNELSTNRTGQLDQSIDIGGPKYSLDVNALIPAGSGTAFELHRFDKDNSPPPFFVDMSGHDVTVTVYFTDGTDKSFTFTV